MASIIGRSKIPLGAYPEVAAKGMNNTGTENCGGLVFVAAETVARPAPPR